MRQLKFIGFILYVLIGTIALSCENIKDTTNINQCSKLYESVSSLKDVTGIIGFDEVNDKYNINIHVEGTIDEIITVYPCELSEELKVSGLKVKLDGELFKENDLPKPALGGQKIFHIDIKAISIVN